eukprot:6227006-Prymnesium_polylepis.4
MSSPESAWRSQQGSHSKSPDKVSSDVDVANEPSAQTHDDLLSLPTNAVVEPRTPQSEHLPLDSVGL